MKKLSNILQVLKYLLAPLLFFMVISSDISISWNGKLFLGIFSMVVSFWLLTPVPLFISGIFGVALSIIFGITTSQVAFAPFANPVIFLFLGGFLLARSLEKTELDRILAQKILSHPWVSVSAERTVFVFLCLSLVLSMWMSNTATVAMLLPISYGVIKKMELNFGLNGSLFNEKLLLGLAFSATVGGNMTPIGSPPNVIAIGLLKSINGSQITFLEWMFFAAPFSLLLFFCIYKFTVWKIPVEKKEIIPKDEIVDYLKFNNQQKYVLIIFFTTVFLWVFPSLVSFILSEESVVRKFLMQNLSAPVVSIFLACFLFLVPLFDGEKILDSNDVSQIDWSSLLLFGSGLSLGQILFNTGGAEFLMNLIRNLSGGLGVGLIIAILLMFTIFFTEIASNTATANILLPVVISLGMELGHSPTILALTFAFACNSAFMMPVATPPNAIVYGTHRVDKRNMMKSGVLFNFIGLCLLILMNIFLK